MEDIQLQQKADELGKLIVSDISVSSIVSDILGFLPACEYELILFMQSQGKWTGPVPSPPPNFKPGDGNVELGLFLFWLNYPQFLDLSNFTLVEQLEILGLILALQKLKLIPVSQMTTANAEFFNNGELIYLDGSVLSAKKYATYDQGWFVAFLNLVETVTRKLWYNGGQFPSVKPPIIQLTGASPNAVNIALVGDWGTGDETSAAVMKSIESFNPDYIVHVGDVYYAGTPLPTSPQGAYYFAPNEETQNLFECWPSSYAGKSFTLNSNHEMYSGANGYFYDALTAANSPFVAQNGASSFALQYGGWTILGLDSAFMASSLDAFMTGSIGGSDGSQGQWIRSLGLNPENTIVLTHHNGFDFDCSAISTLWAEVKGALGGDPYAWYWGHVHNGIVYDRPLSIPGLTTSTFSRCLGHGALPYGLSPALKGKPVAWQASNSQPAPSLQLYNGFAILSLTTDTRGKLNGVTENFYDISSDSAKWTSQIFPVS